MLSMYYSFVLNVLNLRNFVIFSDYDVVVEDHHDVNTSLSRHTFLLTIMWRNISNDAVTAMV